MNKITITVDVDGNSVTRDFKFKFKDTYETPTTLGWGLKIEDMLDTLAKSHEKAF